MLRAKLHGYLKDDFRILIHGADERTEDTLAQDVMKPDVLGQRNVVRGHVEAVRHFTASCDEINGTRYTSYAMDDSSSGRYIVQKRAIESR